MDVIDISDHFEIIILKEVSENDLLLEKGHSLSNAGPTAHGEGGENEGIVKVIAFGIGPTFRLELKRVLEIIAVEQGGHENQGHIGAPLDQEIMQQDVLGLVLHLTRVDARGRTVHAETLSDDHL